MKAEGLAMTLKWVLGSELALMSAAWVWRCLQPQLLALLAQVSEAANALSVGGELHEIAKEAGMT